jgi:hypothetical protein
MMRLTYGFRIVGTTATRRRLVDAAAAFAAYARCDPRAEFDRESYLSAFSFGPDFRGHLRSTGSTRGFDGPCWAAFLWFDIDRPDDPGRALADTRRLAGFLLHRYTTLDDEALLLFFSGGKGYHTGLPVCWDAPASPIFHRVARRFAERLADRAGVQIDTSIYDKVRAFRAPNSKHPRSRLHKRRLTFDELNGLTAEGIRLLAVQPEPFDLPPAAGTNEQAAADWRDATVWVHEQAEGKAARRVAALNGAPTLNRQTLAFIRDGAELGDRHRLLFSAAANLSEFGCPPALAHALLTEAALDSGLQLADVRRQIECGLAHMAKQGEGRGND